MSKPNYEQLAMRTLSPNYFPMHVDDFRVKDALLTAANTAKRLDAYKKVMFYGKANTFHKVDTPLIDLSCSVPADVIHAIIGLITEAGELAEALLKSIDNGDLIDLVNIGEEGGDCLWYLALLAKGTNTTMKQMGEVNIAKLAKRYPEKFDEYLAENRNLEEEQKILEKGLTKETKEVE